MRTATSRENSPTAAAREMGRKALRPPWRSHSRWARHPIPPVT